MVVCSTFKASPFSISCDYNSINPCNFLNAHYYAVGMIYKCGINGAFLYKQRLTAVDEL